MGILNNAEQSTKEANSLGAALKNDPTELQVSSPASATDLPEDGELRNSGISNLTPQTHLEVLTRPDPSTLHHLAHPGQRRNSRPFLDTQLIVHLLNNIVHDRL